MMNTNDSAIQKDLLWKIGFVRPSESGMTDCATCTTGYGRCSFDAHCRWKTVARPVSEIHMMINNGIQYFNGLRHADHGTSENEIRFELSVRAPWIIVVKASFSSGSANINFGR